MPDINTNALYFGDNLEILRKLDYFPDGSVDLIYLDPPFNSRADYNVLFREPTGERSAAQIKAFTDTWHWDMAAQRTYEDIITGAPLKVSKAIEALHEFIGPNDVMAYLVMMTVRLVELHRVLKGTGSLYLHCDPTASHYLKVILDTIFGPWVFKNELIWRRTYAHNDPKRYGRVHDVILYYTKSEKFFWNVQYKPHDPNYVERNFRYADEDGRKYRLNELTARKPGGDVEYEWRGVKPPRGRYWAYSKANMEKFEAQRLIVYSRTGFPRIKQYLDNSPGVAPQDLLDDISYPMGKERLGFATQKPLALLERIIAASSNEGDVVLDPFCGCGTAVVAAQKLGRRWIGIDITYLAINVMNRRLKDSFALEPDKDYQIVGRPRDVAGAEALARRDRYQFQWWALDLVDAQPREPDRKKGADAGVDGVISFVDDRKGKAGRIVVQVKSGNVGARDIRDLKGVIGDQDMGLFITLQPSTEPMRVEAASAGFHRSELWEREFPRLQIFTIDQLLRGERPDLPPKGGLSDFARASRIREPSRQLDMGEGAT